MNRKQLARAKQLSRPSNLQRGNASSWYRIKNTSTEETEVFIYDEIGYWGVTADDFVRDIAAIDTPKIKLRVNSPGGDVFDGIAIYNGLVTHPAEVTAVIDGLAASAASFIVCAAGRTEIHRNAQMMVHDARGVCMGNAADMQEMMDLLNMASDNIADIYAQKTGDKSADWRTVMKEEKWYTADDAVEAGLADGIVAQATKKDAEPVEKEEDADTESDDLEDLQGLDLAALMKDAFSTEGVVK